MTQVFNRDCMEAMKEFPDKFFELAIVDPPYGIGDFTRPVSKGRIVNRKYKIADWNDDIPKSNYFDELNRISKNQIIWGANYYNCFNNGGTIVWDKVNNHPDMSRCEIASCSLIRTVKYFQYAHYGFSEHKDRIHPCQKPVAVYKYCLSYAKEGDKILDTHLGSGSSRIAADQMGFDFWGYELDKDYFEASVKRFNQYKAQTVLF